MATPNTRLMTTAQPATVTVSASACWTSGDDSELKNVSTPSWNARLNTSAVGHATRSTTYTTTMLRSAHRPSAGRRSVRMAPEPPLEQVEGDDRQQCHHEQHRADRRGRRAVAVLDVGEHAHGRDLGVVGEVAGEQHEGAVLADAA